MESRRVCDCLDVLWRLQIGISSGDCRELPIMQVRDCLGKNEIGIKVRIIIAAAVPSPPTGIESELHEVGKPKFSAGTGGGAARQGAELIQINWLRAFRHQVCVKECEVGALILGIIMDILIHIPIQDFQGFGVDWIASSAWFFAVLDSTELIVLDPKIGLEDFRRSRESEKGRITGCDCGRALLLLAKRICG
jgi:hypothetical protein